MEFPDVKTKTALIPRPSIGKHCFRSVDLEKFILFYGHDHLSTDGREMMTWQHNLLTQHNPSPIYNGAPARSLWPLPLHCFPIHLATIESVFVGHRSSDHGQPNSPEHHSFLKLSGQVQIMSLIWRIRNLKLVLLLSLVV